MRIYVYSKFQTPLALQTLALTLPMYYPTPVTFF